MPVIKFKLGSITENNGDGSYKTTLVGSPKLASQLEDWLMENDPYGEGPCDAAGSFTIEVDTDIVKVISIDGEPVARSIKEYADRNCWWTEDKDSISYEPIRRSEGCNCHACSD